ncbi:MAG: MFS transporter [Streptosporangiales bacterium]|nr:MFS transporter [Streptosporangiales bacterium]
MRALTSVMSTRHVPRLLSAMLVGRLPTGMAALAVVLVVRAQGGGYTVAGVLAGAYAVGQAIGAPFVSRAVDMWRQPPVLVLSAVVSAVGFCAFAAVDVGSRPVLAGVAVLVAGAATPPIEPCLRVLWSDLLSDDDVHAAYSLDTAMQELIFTFGPLVVIGMVALAGPGAGPVAAGVLCVAGTLVFASARPSRRWRGTAVERHWAGPLRSLPLVRLLFAVACVGLTIGTFTVAVTAHAEDVATRSAAAWLLAANAVGGLAGGVANTMTRPARDPSRRLFWLMALLAVGYVPLAAAPGLWATLPLAVVSGLALPPVLACAMVLVDMLAPAGTVTEAFAWIVTAFGTGYALGSALAGVMLDTLGYPYAIIGAVVVAGLGAALVRARLARPVTPTTG